MAARTTDVLVKALMAPGRDYDLRKNPDLTPYITTANVHVNRIEAAGEADAVLLELIERWLAAHFYKMSDQAYSARSTQGASGTFQGQTGQRLMATKYGQTALDLDGTGYLASLVSSASGVGTASIEWAGGGTPSDQ